MLLDVFQQSNDLPIPLLHVTTFRLAISLCLLSHVYQLQFLPYPNISLNRLVLGNRVCRCPARGPECQPYTIQTVSEGPCDNSRKVRCFDSCSWDETRFRMSLPTIDSHLKQITIRNLSTASTDVAVQDTLCALPQGLHSVHVIFHFIEQIR